MLNYRIFKKENESVLFPKRFINYGSIKPVEYQIYVVKEREKGDKNRFLRDEAGKLYEEKPLFGKWTVIDSANYEFEEDFWVYGHNPRTDRITIHDIMKLVMKGAYKKKMVKQVIVVHNN